MIIDTESRSDITARARPNPVMLERGMVASDPYGSRLLTAGGPCSAPDAKAIAPRYTCAMHELTWGPGTDSSKQIRALCSAALTQGLLSVRFEAGSDGRQIAWSDIEALTRSRAVTVADVAADLESPDLDLALCCDLVYLRTGVSLLLPEIDRPPSPGLAWALSRAGRSALTAGLLSGGPLDGEKALRLGLAQGIVAPGDRLPLPGRLSIAALTAARDLMRARARGAAGRALELATFRLLFASGDPIEGAQAFLDRREPDFRNHRTDGP
jgi:hypothetical protein